MLLSRVVQFLCLVVLASFFSAQPGISHAQPQYVVISFDGAKDIAQWERSRALARKTGAQFTYFLSCVYLLTRDNRGQYMPPRHGRGASNVGFAETRDDIARRLRQIWAARLEGHDIASHGCGHFDGGDWTRADWTKEFQAFRTVLADAWKNNRIPFEPSGWRDFARHGIEGFRAPYLSTGKPLFEALADAGYVYDASTVSRGPARPDVGAPIRFSLPTIPEGPKARRIIAMDYNLFVRHSGGIERTAKSAEFEERAYQAFTRAFEEQHGGTRVPLQIGFHFTLMNDAAYWRALERFATDVCGRSEVRCVSYRTLSHILRHDDSTASVAPGN